MSENMSFRTYEDAILDGDTGLIGSDIFPEQDETADKIGRIASQKDIIGSETFWGIGVGDISSDIEA